MERRAAIETHDLSIGYVSKKKQNYLVHNHLDLQLFSGEVTCLLGLNGAGKSTLLRTLCGFQPALSGTISILGKPLVEYSQTQFSLTVGVVLTEKTNAGGITVYELVSLGRHPYTGFFGQLKPHDHEIINNALQSVGIAHKAASYVSELSDGERQKAMIAKTLAQECPIILLDEPTAFLDVTSRIETMVLLHRLAAEQNKAILLSTHDLDLAIQMGDRLWLEEKGRAMACGSPEDLILDGTFETFFGKDDILFDKTNGKLYTKAPKRPIGIDGDPITTYWAGNALVRNGYLPSKPEASLININCVTQNDIRITFANKAEIQVKSIGEMVAKVKERE